ncbi:MAG: N-6 DNA methylase [Candidatus Saccharimonadales bacterium]
MDKVKQLGQYFTPDFVADFMVSLSTKPKNSRVLEPSCGEGVFLDSLKNAGYTKYTGLEIDGTLDTSKHTVRNESFISAKFDTKFDLIIGNPPYVRWKNMAKTQKDELAADPLWNKYFNSLSDYLYIFILKSVELLEEGGELIFITPEYWLGTMHSRPLRNYLVDHGYAEEIYHFSETPVFSKVASAIIIFKYVKTRKAAAKTATVYRYSSRARLSAPDLQAIGNNGAWSSFKIRPFTKNSSWILAPNAIRDELDTYEKKCQTGFGGLHQPTLIPEDEVPYVRLGDIAAIANGLVSGFDMAFRLADEAVLNQKEKLAVLSVIKAKDMQPLSKTRTRRYIFLNGTTLTEKVLAKDYPAFYRQLKNHKAGLGKRYAYGKNIPYWEWVFLRSISLFDQDTRKIFVPCKERITNKDRLRFCLAEPNEYPTQDVTAVYLRKDVKESIYYILALLNSKVTYDWVRYKGLVKGGVAEFSERPLSAIPIRLIDWTNAVEVLHHKKIGLAVRRYLAGNGSLEEIDRLVLDLLG